MSFLPPEKKKKLTLKRTFAATAPGAQETIEAWASSVDSVILHTGTFKSNFLEPIPTEVRSVWSSVFDAQVSIAAKAGYVIQVEGRAPVQTGSPGSAATATKPVLAAAVAVAGFMGVVALL